VPHRLAENVTDSRIAAGRCLNGLSRSSERTRNMVVPSVAEQQRVPAARTASIEAEAGQGRPASVARR
jgi:hypothetical protein